MSIAQTIGQNAMMTKLPKKKYPQIHINIEYSHGETGGNFEGDNAFDKAILFLEDEQECDLK